ncbi:MAG: substrate-binding domain-containing protein [Betaproteobacteria bacterium]
MTSSPSLRSRPVTRRNCLAQLLTAAGLPLAASQAGAAGSELTVLSIVPMKDLLNEGFEVFRRETGLPVVVHYVSLRQLKAQLHGDEHPDLLIADRESVDALKKSGGLSADTQDRIALGRIGLGIAAPQGRALPPMSTPEDLSKHLLAAKALLHADPSESIWGRQAQALLDRLGIAKELKPRLQVGSGSNPMAAMNQGGIDLAIHSTADLLANPGLQLAPALPASLQQWVPFDAHVVEDAGNADSARRLAKFLQQGAAVRAIWSKKGFEMAAP